MTESLSREFLSRCRDPGRFFRARDGRRALLKPGRSRPRAGTNTSDQSHRSPTRVSLTDVEDRTARIRTVVDGWVEDLRDRITAARASEQFQRRLDAQQQFHDYSCRNTLLIKRQRPEATKVAGSRTWQDEFDPQVMEWESAIRSVGRDASVPW